MSKLEIIKELQQKLENFRIINQDLDENLSELKSIISSEEFIPYSLNEIIQNKLEKINDRQKDFFSQYKKLEEQTLPKNFSEIEKILHKQKRKIKTREKYMEAVTFFIHLHSEDNKTQNLIEQRKQHLLSLNLELMTEEEIKKELQGYIWLLDAYKESDPVTKFSFMYKLSSCFEEEIAMGVQFHTFTILEDGRKIIEEVTTKAQNQKEEIEDKIKIQEQEEETEDTKDLEDKIKIQEQNIEFQKQKETDVEFWKKIEIENPEEMIVQEDTSLLRVEISPKANAKFGVKEFKKDIIKRASTEKVYCFIEALEGFGYTTKSLSIWGEKEPIYYEFSIEKLFQLGYLKKYVVQGYEEFYTLSSRGEKAFTSKDSILFINNHSKQKKRIFKHMEDKTNSAINRLLCFSVYSKILQINKKYEFISRLLYMETDFFFCIFPKVINNKNIAFFGITTEDPMEFEKAYQYLKHKEKEEIELLIMIGVTRELAFHLANWVSKVIENKISIWYCGYSDINIYDFATKEAIELSEIEKEQEKDIERIEEEVETVNLEEIEKIEEEVETVNLEEIEKIEEEVETVNLVEEIEKVEEEVETVNLIEEIEKVEEEVETVNLEDIISNKSIGNISDIDKKKHNIIYQKMLVKHQFYAAVAYVKALSQRVPYYETVYHQLAYALNDPMEGCNYCSDSIFSIYYYEETPISDHYVVAATIRNYFLDQYNYDYNLQQLQTMLTGNLVLCKNPALSKVVYTLQQFKTDYHSGMDKYANYREKERTLWEKRLEEIKRDANGYFENYCRGNVKEVIPHRRFMETNKLLLGLDSELSEYLQIVIKDDRDMLELLEAFLIQNYVKDQAIICEENLDHEKINVMIDTYWELSAQNVKSVKKTADLMSSLRTNLYKRIKKVVGVLCDYVFLMKSAITSEDDTALCAYKKLYHSLLNDIHDAEEHLTKIEDIELSEKAGNAVILVTLQELESRLIGDYKEGSNKFFYINFLKNDKVLLDEDFFPVLEDVLELPDFYITNRIVQHCQEEGCNWGVRLQEIFNGEDDYGSAELILIYLRMQSIVPENIDVNALDLEKAIIFPQKDMENKRREFMEDLELAQSYGQIDNTVENSKETMIQIMDNWYLWAIDTKNYGFFDKILAAFKEKIKKDAQVHALELEQSLAIHLEKNTEWKEDTLIHYTVEQIRDRIKQQNYAAAEDLFNRLLTKDLDLDVNFEQTDYLEEFIKEYESNYRKTANSGTTLKSLLYGSKINKDTKGGDRLLESWPKGAGFGESALKILLSTLGFIPELVKNETPIQDKIKSFFVTLKRPQNGRKSNYKHPISAFGSEAEEKGFRVVCIFGKTDASRLIDTFKEIGNAKHTIVLLDYALTLADRRTLARKTKTDLTGKIFAVIDRVVLVYLAKHYTETAINRMLMSVIMPFASYQPYIDKSADVMPQELFIGRKNELEKIESPTGVNIVYGGRQLGKTALLRMAKKDIDMDENGDRAIIVSVWGKDYHATAKAISEALYDEKILKEEHITEDWNELVRDIKNRLRDDSDPIPYLLLMIDEADVFIESCEEIGYQPFDDLKNIQSIGSGRFKFVVAGLRNIVRFKRTAALGKNRVLTHFDSLTVKPFKSMEARELLEVPLSYLGFRFPKDNETEVLISTIFGTTNYFPGLIQLYCTKLIEAMKRDYAGYSESETPPYIVRKEHIKKVLAEQTLQQDIREKFYITLKVGEDDYYYIIALLVAHHYHENKSKNGCSAKDLIEMSELFSIGKLVYMEEEKISALMEEMCELNVLQHTGDGRYRFARHSFCQMMGTIQQIDDELLVYMED